MIGSLWWVDPYRRLAIKLNPTLGAANIKNKVLIYAESAAVAIAIAKEKYSATELDVMYMNF